MTFRRVLVATALVAVLASSLFSGWLTNSPSPFKPLVAYAQTDPTVTACNTANDQGQFIGTSGAQFNSVTNGYEIKLVLEALTASALNPTAKLYKKRVADTAYESLTTVSLAKTPGSPFLGNDKWAGSYTDSFANTLADIGNYILLVKATFNGQAISKCYQKLVLPTGGGSSGSIYTKDVVQAWLGNTDLPGLKINIYETANTPPKVIIPKSKLGDRPPEDLTFKLVAHSGEGAFFIGNKDWMTFQGYVGSTKVDYFYFQISDDLDANFIYDTDFAEVVKGHDTPTGTELNRAVASEGSILGNSIGDLFTYIMNVPKNYNDSVGGENCGTGSTAKLLYTVGPRGKGVSQEANISRTTEVGVDGRRARLLNQNCLNDAANSANGGSANGWLAYWGVKNVFSSDPGSTCGLNSLVSIFKDGVGVAVVKLFACVVQNIIDGIFKPLEDATQGAGKETGALECNLAGETNAQIPASCQEPGRDGPPNSSFYKAWKYSLGLINVLVILALLAIAFANILHLNLNTYAAKKALPGLVIGVVGANASLLLIRFILDVAKALQLFAFDIAGVTTTGEFVGAFMTKIGMTAFENAIVNGVLITLGPITLIVILIFAIYMFYLVFVFAWGMIKRLVYIYGLTVLAPLAFVSYGIPGQQQWFTKWWDMMLRQIFMLPVVFLGAAMLIKYVKITVEPKNITEALDISSMINMLLVFLTATAILKLPGIITKGAVDIAGAAKKAFGMAKQTPLRAVSNYQGAHEFFKGGGKERFSAGVYRKFGLKTQAKTAADAAREKRLGYKDKYKGSLSWIKGARGYAKLVDDPGILWDSYQERIKQMQKDDKIAALTRTHRIPGKLRGGSAEAILAKSLAREELKDATDKADYGDWNTGLGGSHLDKVYGKNRSKIPDGLWKAILDAAGGNEEQAEEIRRRMGSIGSEEAMLNFIEKDTSKGGLGITNQWNIHDLMKVAGYESRITEGANRVRLPEGATAGKSVAEVMLMRRKMIDPDGDRGAGVWTPPPPGSGPAPSGGPASGTGGGAAASGGPDRPPDNPPGGGGNGGGVPGGKVQKVFVTNPVQIQNPQNDALFNKLAEHAQTLMDTIGSEKLAAHAAASGGDVGKLLSGEVGEAIKGEIGHLVNEGGGQLIHELVSSAISGDAGRLQSMVARGEIIDRTGQEMASEAAQFSDEQMDRLAETVGKSVSEGVQSISGVIAPYFQKLGITDPKIIAAYGQKVIDGLQTSINKGPKSLRANMESQFTRLIKTVAQEQGLDHIDNASLARVIGERQTQSAPPSNVTNVTNTTNVQSAPPILPAQPAQTDIPSTPANPEPPTQ